MLCRIATAAFLALVGAAHPVSAAEIKVLTAGAMKEVVLSVVPDFERRTGHKVTVDNATVGVLSRRIREGEAFDVAVMTPAAVDEMIAAGKLAPGSRVNLARVGVGVVVKEGAPRPDIATVEALKAALLAAKSVAYIDPASGGSSGIYVARLLEQLGIAEQVKRKAKLKQGGHVADLVVSGEAEIGLHQISEIIAVKGATLVGPLPAAIQNYTTYAAAIGARSQAAEAAKALVAALASPAAEAFLKSRGLERAP